MIIVDVSKCNGCGRCVKDCFPNNLQLIDNKAVTRNTRCINCGHCIAICPENALAMNDHDMSEIIEYDEEKFKVDSEHLLNFIKFRRTVRQFTNQMVTDDQIKKIIEAGRYTQTASNQQDVSYIVIREKLQELKELVYKSLKEKAEGILDNLSPGTEIFRDYAYMWLKMNDEFESGVKDRLFFDAPVVIIVTSRSKTDGTLASSNMELMTNAIGLGTLFSGFFILAADDNVEISNFLNVQSGKFISTCMIIGHPDVEYKRTAPRKKADIVWN